MKAARLFLAAPALGRRTLERAVRWVEAEVSGAEASRRNFCPLASKSKKLSLNHPKTLRVWALPVAAARARMLSRQPRSKRNQAVKQPLDSPSLAQSKDGGQWVGHAEQTHTREERILPP